MRTTDPGDAACIELLLAELRLPAIKLVWASLAAQADKEGWPAGRSWQHWPNMRLPSAAGPTDQVRGLKAHGSNATSLKPGCRPARPSTPLTLRPSR
jgi:hypothetical protein